MTAESAFLVPVPAAEPWVADLRARYDPVALLGVPAHITLLVPFMSPASIGRTELGGISSLLRSARAFEFTLRRIGRFPQTTYLAPEPREPFVELVEALARRFPEYPPYGGEFPVITPHLTVADGSAELSAVAATELARIMGERGPIHATCDHVDLYENSVGRWRRAHSFPLAG